LIRSFLEVAAPAMTTPTKDAAGGAVEASMGHPSLKDITMQVVQKLRGAANYDNWQWGIRLILEEHKVLNVVLGTESEPTAKAPAEVKEIFGAKNRRGLIILASNVDITLMSHIKPHKLAKDAWAELESVFASHALAHQLYLREKYRGLKQKDGETVQSFSTRLQEVAQELATSGAPVDRAGASAQATGGCATHLRYGGNSTGGAWDNTVLCRCPHQSTSLGASPWGGRRGQGSSLLGQEWQEAL